MSWESEKDETGRMGRTDGERRACLADWVGLVMETRERVEWSSQGERSGKSAVDQANWTHARLSDGGGGGWEGAMDAA